MSSSSTVNLKNRIFVSLGIVVTLASLFGDPQTRGRTVLSLLVGCLTVAVLDIFETLWPMKWFTSGSTQKD